VKTNYFIDTILGTNALQTVIIQSKTIHHTSEGYLLTLYKQVFEPVAH